MGYLNHSKHLDLEEDPTQCSGEVSSRTECCISASCAAAFHKPVARPGSRGSYRPHPSPVVETSTSVYSESENAVLQLRKAVVWMQQRECA